jgi:broad specificity phosphatase PhoE
MKINLFFVRHGESLSNKNRDIFYPDTISLPNKIIRLFKSINYEPTLSLNGIKQSKILKQTLKNYNFDLFICSNLIRSIMTGIFAIKYTNEIIILPFINEHLNFLGEIDKSNKINNYEILKLKLEYLNNWTLSKKILSPKINLEYYNEETKNLLYDDYVNPNIEKFINILNKIIKNNNFNKDEINICIISHGTFIRKEVYKYFYNEELNRKLLNTEVISFSYNL